MIMSNSGGHTVSRLRGSDRFYSPPAVRRQQQLLLQQQQLQRQLQQLQRQLQKPSKAESRIDLSEVENRTDSDESTLSRPHSACSSSPPRNANLTNLDRLMESVTPIVTAQFSEVKAMGWRNRDANSYPFFCLGDLWESFSEWSVYGLGVPLLLNGCDSVKQYYVPSLSGIQLYVDPTKLRRAFGDSDAESSRETSSDGSSDCETERRVKGVINGALHNLVNLNSSRMNNLNLRDVHPKSSSGEEIDVGNSLGLLVFEYLEQEQPHHRLPLYDKVTNLASQFPELSRYRSCELHPASWISVAWYPIYRIPVGPTLQNLDASFLTFHSLSTNSRTGTVRNQPQLHASRGMKKYGVNATAKLSLPVFGLAYYKLRGSILTPNGEIEWQQASSLLQAADNWLRHLQVNLPDFQFFLSHNNSHWR